VLRSVLLRAGLRCVAALLVAVAATLVGARPAAATPVLDPGPGGFVAVTPFRLVDTREPATSTAVVYGGPRLNAGETATFRVYDPADRSLPPTGLGAVVLNVTAVNPAAAGYLTVWPAGQPRPLASVVNFERAGVVPNAVTVQLPPDLRVAVFSPVATDLVVDVLGVYAAAPSGPGGGGFGGVAPRRLLDTRTDPSPAPFAPSTTPGVLGGTYQGLPVVGGEVPADAVAVVLNVTAVPRAGSSPGYVTVFPAGRALPTASHVNTDGRTVVPNQVTVRVGAGGKVDLYVHTPTDLVVDVMGWYAAGAAVRGGFTPLAEPTRFMDTRRPGIGYLVDPVTNQPVCVLVDRSGIPAAAEAAVVNVTVTEPTNAGFVTVWPDTSARPLVSSLNYVTGQTVANAATVGLGISGGLALYTRFPAQLVLDVAGWFTSPYRLA
jgi:hypothetical protein